MDTSELRRVVDRKTRFKAEDLTAMLEPFEAVKEVVQELIDALDEISIDAFEAVLEKYEALVEYDLADVDRLGAARTAVVELFDSIPTADEKPWEDFVQNYDAAAEAIDSYTDAKESDSYPGKGDDVAAAYEDVRSAFEVLSDAADALEEVPVSVTAN